MVVSELQLFKFLSEQLGKEKAESIVQYVEAKVEKELNDKTQIFATKQDIAILNENIVKLETKIAESKVDMIKWLVVLIIGLFFSMSGVMIALFNAFNK